MNDADPAGRRLPVKVDTTTNGEFAPIPLERAARHANALADERASTLAKYLGKTRRQFLVSTCGAASSLLALNAAHAAAGRTSGFFEVSKEAAFDVQLAAAELARRNSSSTCRATT